ncbi:hypothetical protein M3231_08405 [Neobacillus mesonae]|nr:hypothetical protein [Neobacillus mesonae]
MAVIIYPKTMIWKFMKQRLQQLMTELGSQGHHVFFENLAPMTSQLEEAAPGVQCALRTKTGRSALKVLPLFTSARGLIGLTTSCLQSLLQNTLMSSLYRSVLPMEISPGTVHYPTFIFSVKNRTVNKKLLTAY